MSFPLYFSDRPFITCKDRIYRCTYSVRHAFCHVIFDFVFANIYAFFSEFNLMDTKVKHCKKITYNLTRLPRCYHHFLMGCYQGMFVHVFRYLGMKKGILDYFRSCCLGSLRIAQHRLVKKTEKDKIKVTHREWESEYKLQFITTF